MSERSQWKMIHLLNTSKKGELSEAELIEMGVDCFPDTIQYLQLDGIVERDYNGIYRLHPTAMRLLNKFLLTIGPAGMKEIYVDVPSCFVVMPFSQPWSDVVFNDLIKPALADAGMDCVRGDLIPRVGKLSDNIVRQMQKTGLVIAEISVPNANVFYELGIADTIGRDVFLLYEKAVQGNLPADIQGAHYYAYDRTDIAGSRIELAKQLQQWKQQNHVDVTLKYCRK